MKITKHSKKIYHTLRNEGFLETSIKSLQKIQKITRRSTDKVTKKRQFISLVDKDNVLKADWSNHKYTPAYKKRSAPYRVAWLMSPPAGGGGHQNIFRFIDFLDQNGYSNDVYLYSTFDDSTVDDAIKNTRKYSKAKNTKFYMYKRQAKIQSDILFATGWETAYPVFNHDTDAIKLYFIQDFEPYFYPMGTDYILAENTYKFGFKGITAGGWLAKKLHDDYGMQTDSYDFGANKDLYSVINTRKRSDIFFYARPVTERRGFDLGLMALELFHKEMPNCTIHMAGWDVSEWAVPFPYVNHGAVQMEDLKAIYNQCSAALVMSLTNMSLLPLELLSSGVIPVVNEGPNNRLVSNNENISYVESSPRALADALIEAVKKNGNSEVSERISESVNSDGWESSGKKFIELIEMELKRVK